MWLGTLSVAVVLLLCAIVLLLREVFRRDHKRVVPHAKIGTGVVDYDVIIVGGGPVGFALAGLLGQRNLSALVIEREAEICFYPRCACVLVLFLNQSCAEPEQSMAMSCVFSKLWELRMSCF